MMYCHWCGEPLRYAVGRGWVHPDGNIYKQKIRYVESLGREEPVDDHVALPVPAENFDGPAKR